MPNNHMDETGERRAVELLIALVLVIATRHLQRPLDEA